MDDRGPESWRELGTRDKRNNAAFLITSLNDEVSNDWFSGYSNLIRLFAPLLLLRKYLSYNYRSLLHNVRDTWLRIL